MTEHWKDHSLDFSTKPDFQEAEGQWNKNGTGFAIKNTNRQDPEINARREVYKETDPDVTNLKKRQDYAAEVRADPSYRFLMMIAAFSKKKLGTVMKAVYKPQRVFQNVYNPVNPAAPQTFIAGRVHGVDVQSDDIIANTTLSATSAWMSMSEISGNIELTPLVYGHIKEAQMIVDSFNTNRVIPLKTLIENQPYQTLFARLVAIRMGLTNYFDSSDKQKDKLFSRLHQEQSMLLRRINQLDSTVVRNYSSPN